MTNQAQLMLRKQQVDLKIADDYSYILERKLKEAQAEIDFLKKEILEKHEDWKHEGQQAANARAEIEALKKVLQEVVRISDRNHDAWNKAKELLK